jgi:hypothetical protein
LKHASGLAHPAPLCAEHHTITTPFHQRDEHVCDRSHVQNNVLIRDIHAGDSVINVVRILPSPRLVLSRPARMSKYGLGRTRAHISYLSDSSLDNLGLRLAKLPGGGASSGCDRLNAAPIQQAFTRCFSKIGFLIRCNPSQHQPWEQKHLFICNCAAYVTWQR